MDKVDLPKLSFPRRIDKVGSFTPRYNTTEQLPSSQASWGHIMRSCGPAHKGRARKNYWVDVTNTKELIGACPHMLPHGRHHQDSTCYSTRWPDILRSARRPVSFMALVPVPKLEAGVGEPDLGRVCQDFILANR